ncbi:hypothetical protein BKA64DRAFT_109360 [Cadophora sp. MPI-SDFR-AT-0126]|nr:hypothetical protein BKA64DRAFT_109360 [Leotiomycetes sp. MPI-SDFR-AT-0126]
MRAHRKARTRTINKKLVLRIEYFKIGSMFGPLEYFLVNLILVCFPAVHWKCSPILKPYVRYEPMLHSFESQHQISQPLNCTNGVIYWSHRRHQTQLSTIFNTAIYPAQAIHPIGTQTSVSPESCPIHQPPTHLVHIQASILSFTRSHNGHVVCPR